MSLRTSRSSRRAPRDLADGIRNAATAAAQITLSSNDYLGLSRHPAVVAAAQEALAEYGFGSSGTRAVAANHRLFGALERRIAEFKHVDAGLVFQSGYAANTGMIPALVGPGDLVIHDAFNHASCADGARLSRAAVRTYRHRDIDDLERLLAGRRGENRRVPGSILIVSDGVFGLEGDIAPLPDICAVAERHGATVVVDDAHATGVLGHNGRGSVDHFGLAGRIEVQVGSLSKALGGVGGYVGTSAVVRNRLLATSHPILYSTLPPAMGAAAAIAALGILESEPDRVERLWTNTRFLRGRLLAAGFDLGASETPIVPLYAPSRDVAQAFASRLRGRGVIVGAADPRRAEGASPRLRIIVRSDLSDAELATCADAIEEVGRELGAADW